MKEPQGKTARHCIINTETGETEAAADHEPTISGYLRACTPAERKPLIVRTRYQDMPASEWMIRHPSPQRHPHTVKATMNGYRADNGGRWTTERAQAFKTRDAIPAWLNECHRSARAGQIFRYTITLEIEAVNTLTPSYKPDDYPPPQPETEPADEGLEYYIDALDEWHDGIIDAMTAVDAAISAGQISAEDVEVMEYQKVYRRMDYRQADHERQIMNYYTGDPDQYPDHPEYQTQIASSH